MGAKIQFFIKLFLPLKWESHIRLHFSLNDDNLSTNVPSMNNRKERIVVFTK